MINIKKSEQPKDLRDFKEKFPNATYNDLPYFVKEAIRTSLLFEQGFVCCFCGQRIGSYVGENIIEIEPLKKDKHNIRISHIIPQSITSNMSIEYKNLCASCNTQYTNPKIRHCDESQKNNIIPITPLQKDCFNYFNFFVDGKIYPSIELNKKDREKANQTINILNLNEKSLINSRRHAIEEMINILENNKDKINIIFDKIKTKDSNKTFVEFYFVLLKIFNIR